MNRIRDGGQKGLLLWIQAINAQQAPRVSPSPHIAQMNLIAAFWVPIVVSSG